MDLAGADRDALLQALQSGLDEGCLDCALESFQEDAATLDEDALTEYLDAGALSQQTLSALIQARKLFPCWFGSALKLEGVEEFLQGLARYSPRPVYPEQFGARVYKIGRDAQGSRLTYMKITGGVLRVKDSLSIADGGEVFTEKAEQLRLYSGAKFQAAPAAEAGMVCAVTGLSHTRSGQGLGIASDFMPPALEPVLNYRLLLPEGTDPHAVLDKLLALAEEDPQLHILWNEGLQEIRLQLMGQVQLEVLREMIARRFGVQADFAPGGIVYKETIAAAPLRRGPSPAGAGEAGQRPALRLRLRRGPAGAELAAADPDPSGGKAACGRTDRVPRHGHDNHPHRGPRPPQAHRGRRFPAGHLPGGAPGADGGGERAAGALV